MTGPGPAAPELQEDAVEEGSDTASQGTSRQVPKGEAVNRFPPGLGCPSHPCPSEWRQVPALGMLSILCANANLQGSDEEISEGLHDAKYVL